MTQLKRPLALFALLAAASSCGGSYEPYAQQSPVAGLPRQPLAPLPQAPPVLPAAEPVDPEEPLPPPPAVLSLGSLDALTLSAQEQTDLRAAEAQAAATGSSIEGLLSSPLSAKRQAILGQESRLISEILSLAESHRSEVELDSNLEALANSIAATGVDASPSYSLNRIITNVDAEQWAQTEEHQFTWAESLYRNQGLAIDTFGNFYYSGTVSLLRTGYKWGPSLETNFLPIPLNLSISQGDVHVGDIDVANGKLYAPAEDSHVYEHPYIIVYDAFSLKPIDSYAIPTQDQTDGAPWVAVDSASGRAYTSMYGSADRLNVFNLSNMSPLPPILLSRAIPRVQGGKILNGMAYLSSDRQVGGARAVFKVNLKTGTVMEVASGGLDLREQEGLAFSKNSATLMMYVLGLKETSSSDNPILKKLGTRSTLRGFSRTRESRRDRFRKSSGLLPR